MIQYLANVRAVTKDVLVLETLVDLLQIPVPAAAYYPAGILNGDATNYWGPNIACVQDMLCRVGFSRIEFKSLWHVNTIAAIKGHADAATKPIESGRAVFHAYV